MSDTVTKKSLNQFINAKQQITFLRLKKAYFKEHLEREKSQRDGKTPLPYSDAVMKAINSSDFLSWIGVDEKNIIALNPWRTHIITAFWGNGDVEEKKRIVSNLIDNAVKPTQWYRAELYKREHVQKKENGAFERTVAPFRDDSILMDFIWYYTYKESVRIPSPFDDEKQKEEYRKASYPPEFIERLSGKALEKNGATVKEINDFFNSNMATKEDREKAIETLLIPLAKRQGLSVDETISDKGEVLVEPIYREDGSADYSVAMKCFRKIRLENSKISGIIHSVEASREKTNNSTLSSLSTEEYMKKLGVFSEKYVFKKLPDDFINLATSDETFLKSIGLPDESIKVLLSLPKLANANSKEINIIHATVSKYIGGRAASGNKKETVCALSSKKIPKEFSRRQTEMQKFIAEFKTQNSERAKSGYKKPFADEMILKCHNEEFLRKLGMPDDNIEKIMKLYIPASGLNDKLRDLFSKVIGGNNGIRSTEAYNEKTENDVVEVNENSSMIEIYKRLTKESGDTYKNFTYSQGDDKYAVGYSEGLLKALFRTDMLDEIKKASPKNASAMEITKKWITLLPTDSPIIAQNKLNVTKKDILSGLEKGNEDKTTNADFIAASFSMLVRSNCDWNNLSTHQRIEFRRTMNETIKENLFGEYKKSNEITKLFFKERKFPKKTEDKYKRPER